MLNLALRNFSVVYITSKPEKKLGYELRACTKYTYFPFLLGRHTVDKCRFSLFSPF
jgi:hypothetical protein